VELLEAAVIGTGRCGGIRAETLARSALCKKLQEAACVKSAPTGSPR
jgi:hypothetical protein